MNYLYIIILAFALISCTENSTKNSVQVDSNTLTTHQDSLIGWTIEIPAEWRIQSHQSIFKDNIQITEDY